MPIDEWVQIEAHLVLSTGDDGVIQLWQNDQLLIDQRGQTLPFEEAVYDDLEIGLSAHSDRSGPAELFVDDLVISKQPTR